MWSSFYPWRKSNETGAKIHVKVGDSSKQTQNAASKLRKDEMQLIADRTPRKSVTGTCSQIQWLVSCGGYI